MIKKNHCSGRYAMIISIIISGLSLIVFAQAAFARGVIKAGDSMNMNMNIHITGTVMVKESCEFTGQPDVEFNNVYIEQINTVSYKQPINYHLKCPAGDNDSTVNVVVSGARAKYDPSVVATSISGLGIKLLKDGKKILPGDTVTLNADSSTDLSVELTKQESADLPTKEFTSMLILTIDTN